MRLGNMALAVNSFADAIGCFGLALPAKDGFNGIQQIYIVEAEYALILQDAEGEILDTDVEGEDLWHYYTYSSSMVYTINYRLLPSAYGLSKDPFVHCRFNAKNVV